MLARRPSARMRRACLCTRGAHASARVCTRVGSRVHGSACVCTPVSLRVRGGSVCARARVGSTC
eukprot:2705506-Rhodomonas_salina.1